MEKSELIRQKHDELEEVYYDARKKYTDFVIGAILEWVGEENNGRLKIPEYYLNDFKFHVPEIGIIQFMEIITRDGTNGKPEYFGLLSEDYELDYGTILSDNYMLMALTNFMLNKPPLMEETEE